MADLRVLWVGLTVPLVILKVPLVGLEITCLQLVLVVELSLADPRGPSAILKVQ